MIVKSKGIVISYIKYGDTSIIARIFTEAFGYGSYIVNGIRSKNSKKGIGYFQPFSILDLVIYQKESRELQRLAEFKNSVPIHHIYYDLTKSTITLFLAETFSKLLQFEQSPHSELYEFIEESILKLDQIESGVANFHLQFLLKLAEHLGYEIEEAESLFSSIDKLVPVSDDYHLYEAMMSDPYGTTYPLNKDIRNKMLEAILNFYQHHAHISKPKSLEVLRSILN